MCLAKRLLEALALALELEVPMDSIRLLGGDMSS